MALQKNSKCCICHKEFTYKITRLSEQEYGIGRFNQYIPTGKKYDLCDDCYKKFRHWVYKNREV